MASKAKLLKKINETVCQYCTSDWCILKEILCFTHSDPRLFIQLKCIEHRNYELSEKVGMDVGWETAHTEWIDSGCAALFAKYYSEDLTAEEIYSKIINQIPV